MRHNKYFNEARYASLQSTFKFKVGACLVIGKSLFLGWNQVDKTHTHGTRKFFSQHAEMKAIMKAGIRRDFSNAELYVYRSFRNPNFPAAGIAKPCKDCQALIEKVGIPVVYYTIDDHNFGTWSHNNIITIGDMG